MVHSQVFVFRVLSFLLQKFYTICDLLFGPAVSFSKLAGKENLEYSRRYKKTDIGFIYC